jgi:hypothetical protein
MRMGCQVLALLLWVATAVCPAWGATTLYLQVSDVHDEPMRGVVLSAKSSGSVSPPTDVAGKTQITVQGTLQPGDDVVLVLVRAPHPGMRFYTPWEGFATIPKPTGAIPVVLGAPGDRMSLDNASVRVSLANAVLDANAKSVPPPLAYPLPKNTRSYKALYTVSTAVGLDPLEVDDAIRRSEEWTKNETASHTLKRYVEVMPTHDSLADYAKHSSEKQ